MTGVQTCALPIYRHSGQLWAVHRPGFDNGIGKDHPSEAYIAGLPTNALLVNSSTLEAFEDLVRDVAGHRLGVAPTWASND